MVAASTFRRVIAALGAVLASGLAAGQGAPARIYVAGGDLDKMPAGAKLSTLTDEQWKALQSGALGFFCSDRDEPIGAGQDVIPAVQRCNPLRRISKPLEEIEVVRLNVGSPNCNAPLGREVAVTFDEAKRSTLIADNLRTVLKFVADKAGFGEAAPTTAMVPPPKMWCPEPKRHQLIHTRSLLTMKAAYADAKEGDASVSLKMVTGPAEHAFLSGDAVLRGANEVKWDPATRTLVARDKPSQLYLGVNFMVGDLYEKHDSGSWNRMVLKLMVQPTRKPFDGFGVGLGYRFSDGVFTLADKQDNGGFMLFGGAFWTRGESVDANGTVGRGKLERSWRFGVSYSVDSLVGWLK